MARKGKKNIGFIPSGAGQGGRVKGQAKAIAKKFRVPKPLPRLTAI